MGPWAPGAGGSRGRGLTFRLPGRALGLGRGHQLLPPVLLPVHERRRRRLPARAAGAGDGFEGGVCGDTNTDGCRGTGATRAKGGTRVTKHSRVGDH